MRILYLRRNFLFRLVAWVILLTLFLAVGYLALNDGHMVGKLLNICWE